MVIVDIQLERLHEAPWNANRMDNAMRARLRESVQCYGMVENLVARQLANDFYEVLSGNQRLRVLRELELKTAPCVVVDLDDSHARLLAQALNRIQGEDDLAKRAQLMTKVLESISDTDVMSILPETTTSLQQLKGLGTETIAHYLENWQRNRSARLRHLQFQLTADQLGVVQKAIDHFLPLAAKHAGESPNARGTALYLLCKDYLARRDNGR